MHPVAIASLKLVVANYFQYKNWEELIAVGDDGFGFKGKPFYNVSDLEDALKSPQSGDHLIIKGEPGFRPAPSVVVIPTEDGRTEVIATLKLKHRGTTTFDGYHSILQAHVYEQGTALLEPRTPLEPMLLLGQHPGFILYTFKGLL